MLKKGFTLIELLIGMTIVSVLTISGLGSWQKDLEYKLKEKLVDDVNAIISLQEKAKNDLGYYLDIRKLTTEQLEVIKIEDYNFIVSLPNTFVSLSQYNNYCYKLLVEQKNLQKTLMFNNCTDSKPYFLK